MMQPSSLVTTLPDAALRVIRANAQNRSLNGSRRATAEHAASRKTRSRLVHDFRRTAVHRLEWSGVPRSVAMKLTGHETDAVYSRYHIARAKDLRRALRVSPTTSRL